MLWKSDLVCFIKQTMFQDIQQLHMWSGWSGADNYHPTTKIGGTGDSVPSYNEGLQHLTYHHARAEKVHTQQLHLWGGFDDPWSPSVPGKPGSMGDALDSWSDGVGSKSTQYHKVTSEAKPVHPTTRRHYPIGF